MKIKVWYYNFWNNYNEKRLINSELIKYLEEEGITCVLDKINPDVVFINCFGSINYNGPAIKIGFVTEDLNRFTGMGKKINEGYFDLLCGNIPYNKSSKIARLPMYSRNLGFRNFKDYIKNKNDVVKSKNISDLKFCSLIASHDMYGNRMPIFKKLSQVGFIECPGKLNTNVKSFDDEGLTKEQYLNNFIFNICPENHKGHEGYTSEKLSDCISAGCIPIYYGRTDEDLDIKIFNQNRIIRYDIESEELMLECFNKINELMNDKNKLEEFYKQPPYLDDADKYLENFVKEYKKKVIKLLKKRNILNN